MMELVFKFYIRQFIRTNLLSLEAATRGALQKNELLEQPQACNFIEKETLVQVFSYEFCEISKNTFFTEHLWRSGNVCLS